MGIKGDEIPPVVHAVKYENSLLEHCAGVGGSFDPHAVSPLPSTMRVQS